MEAAAPAAGHSPHPARCAAMPRMQKLVGSAHLTSYDEYCPNIWQRAYMRSPMLCRTLLYNVLRQRELCIGFTHDHVTAIFKRS